MAEAEVLEIINLHSSNAINSFTVFISFTFAFLMVTYLIGAKLSRSQTVIISSLYFVSAISWTMTVLTHAHSIDMLVSKYPNYIHSPLWKAPWSITVLTVMGLGFIACLYFMYDTRKQTK